MTETTMTETMETTATSDTEDWTPSAIAAADMEPGLTTVFHMLAGLQMLGGVVLSYVLWPGDPDTGYTWKAVAYVPALTWFTTGIVSGFVFWAIGDGLRYLWAIRRSLEGRA